ncbi:hypothetical protein ACF07D_07645 [Leucobacter sp. NPDC015123]|uniref:hypothetical protein n=1 Tax=Leucobacter sp. NPDC015123 TaxID=3364129 RepID=UPI0036F496B8
MEAAYKLSVALLTGLRAAAPATTPVSLETSGTYGIALYQMIGLFVADEINIECGQRVFTATAEFSRRTISDY